LLKGECTSGIEGGKEGGEKERRGGAKNELIRVWGGKKQVGEKRGRGPGSQELGQKGRDDWRKYARKEEGVPI